MTCTLRAECFVMTLQQELLVYFFCSVRRCSLCVCVTKKTCQMVGSNVAGLAQLLIELVVKSPNHESIVAPHPKMTNLNVSG